MLLYEKGDLIKAAKSGKIDVIAHCANCFNAMKHGIAPQIARAFPEAAAADQETLRGDKSKLGGYTSAISVRYGIKVFNLYGQYGFWKRRKGEMDLDYEALAKAMAGMRQDLTGSEVIGMPKIGAGLALGDWSVISGIIQNTFKNHAVIIYIR